ncbi:MAG: 2-C-methyl-D-erythritol 4-phosphate cytidylyltransferase [Acidimicrobiales bacterium]
MEPWAVVVAAGDGRRFGAAKQFAELAGRRVVDWSLDVAREVCAGVVLVVPAGASEASTFEGSADRVVAGGATRSDSVRRGLAAVPADTRLILVHDAARPLSNVALWRQVIAALEAGADAAIPAVALSDTVKQVVDAGRLVTLDRSKLVAVQTPQGFRAELLRKVHSTQAQATDDAALVETAGGLVELVDGSPDNLKITSPSDLVVAEALIAARRAGTLPR